MTCNLLTLTIKNKASQNKALFLKDDVFLRCFFKLVIPYFL